MSSNVRFARTLDVPRDEADVLREFRSEKPASRLEILIGRTLAFCVHPLAAWPVLSGPWRLLILTAYAAAGYVMVLGARFVLTLA